MKERGAIDWLTIIANFGVVAGLVLVAYEVNQANVQAEAAATQARRAEIQDARAKMALSPDLAEIYVKASTSGVDALTAVERFRLTQWERGKRTRMLGQIEQYRRGFLDRESVENTVRAYTRLENGLWSDLGMRPGSGSIADEIQEIRDELESHDQ